MIAPLLAFDGMQSPMFFFLSGMALLILFIWYFASDSTRRKRNVGTALTLGIVALCLASIYPPGKTLKGGIDIVGGSSFTLKVQPNKDPKTGEIIPLTPQALEQATDIIRKRLNSVGTTDMSIATSGTDTIMVQMPGMNEDDSEAVKEQLQKVAKLELHAVSRQSDQLAQAVYDGTEVVAGFRAYKHETKDREGVSHTEYLLLSTRAAITGSDIAGAWPTQTGAQIDVAIKLTSTGGDKMVNLTSPMSPGVDRIAVLLDDEVLTAPLVQSVPLGQNFVIQGQKSLQEATLLANQLMNPLDNALIIENSSQVSPSAGAAVVKQGIIAGLAAMGIIPLFIFIYYRLAGFIALIGLTVNGLILFGAMAILGASFTMPGIAGLILTMGMAVDANVLIYERLREEFEKGKTLKAALDTAYEKAFTAIFDSNITSLLTAVILFWLASDSVKGFAVTLTIGLLGSLFSAVLVTRVFFRWALDLNLLKKLTMLNVFRHTNFDFMGKRRIAFALSGIMLLASIGAFAVKKDRAVGVDFTGGTLIHYSFPQGTPPIHQTEAENALKDLHTTATPIIQEEKIPGSGNALAIRCDAADTDLIQNAMSKAFPVLNEKIHQIDTEGHDTGKMTALVGVSVDSISATAGKTFLIKSSIAVVLGLLMILLYVSFRFEFAFALGAFLAIVHDVIIAAGAVVLFGDELQLIHIGALLTIAGYSVNDTIVIFDRVRESLTQHSGTLKDLMNEAINATLSRTLLTSTTTVFSLLLLAIFGGAGLRAFSNMILVGLFVGTYSSIFVATALVLVYNRGKNIRKQVVDTQLAANA